MAQGELPLRRRKARRVRTLTAPKNRVRDLVRRVRVRAHLRRRPLPRGFRRAKG